MTKVFALKQESPVIEIDHILDVVNHIQDLRVVVFDLDDTLYSEKEYIRSGYREIARILPRIQKVEVKLWNLFEQKKNAIDELLKNENIYTPELKQQCLSVYRNQKPMIHLYSGVREMLQKIHEDGLSVGMITDGRPEGQRAKIAALGLEPLFDEIIITDELGGIEFRKPSPDAYKLIKTKLSKRIPDIPLEYFQMCYVGDNGRKDFIAPKKLGMHCIKFLNTDGLYIS